MANEKESKSRVNVTVSNELKEWYTKQADLAGCTVSGLMSIALTEYKKNNELIKNMGNLQVLMEELKKMAGTQTIIEKKK